MKTILMGGTLLKVWLESDETGYDYKKILEILSSIFEELGIRGKDESPISDSVITKVCLKESDDVTEADERSLLKAITEDEELDFIVICGTNAMDKIASNLERNLDDNGNTVFFIGGDVPIEIDELPFITKLITAMTFFTDEKPGVFEITKIGDYREF